MRSPTKILIFIAVLCFTHSLSLFGQEAKNSKVSFLAPVDFKMVLSGTFGELRSNHFHAGIDIKTYGVIGKPIHAIADGFVSRIAVSPGGYGKAVYVEHPNGFTSVYAHCNAFSDILNQWVKNQQYARESFQVNLFPERNQFAVKRGDIIAFTGNSGSSAGPHLHFEIRKTNRQIPVNPLFFDFDVKDFVRPTIRGIKIYPVGKSSLINGSKSITSPDIAGWGSEYRIKNSDTLALSGYFYFGIDTYDLLNDANNKNGVYSVALYIDSVLVYRHAMDEVSFAETRYLNSLIDYGCYYKEHRRYQKTYIEPNNKLSIYDAHPGNGIFAFTNQGLHQIKYVVEDANGNRSVLTFMVQSYPPPFDKAMSDYVEVSPYPLFNWDKENKFSSEDFKLVIPEGALYDTLRFQYSVDSIAKMGFYAPTHHVHNPGKALHKWCDMAIRASSVPTHLKEKALIVKIDEDMIAAGGEWDGEFLRTQIRDFGDYSVAIDSLPPSLSLKSSIPANRIQNQKTIDFFIDDDLSGISVIEATLNDTWLLMEWDPKNKHLFYRIDERMKPGENQFYLKVEDGVGNTSVYQAVFTN